MSKLFDKWELDEVKIEDLGLVKYICLDETLVPHTSGRHLRIAELGCFASIPTFSITIPLA